MNPETAEHSKANPARRQRNAVYPWAGWSRRIAFWVLVLLAISCSGRASAMRPDQPRHVLLLNSYHQRMTWVEDVVRAVEDVLRPEDNNLDLHVENMDSKKYHDPEYFDAFRAYLEVKYRNTSFSLILSSDNHAYDFLRAHRDELFPGAPVAFCGVNGFEDEQISDLDRFTGVAEIFSARETVEMALELHPNATEVFVINDYLKTGRAWARDIDEALGGLNDRVRITHAENLPIDALMKQIGGLDPNTIILLGVYFSDRDGRYFTYERMGALLSEASNVPVYCLLEFNIGHGVVGGKVISGYYQGQTMAKIGRRILAGEDPDTIPVVKTGVNRVVFDYVQLERFGLSEADLPPGSVIVNRPFAFYQTYAPEILTALGFIFVLLGAITALLVNITRRTRAERELRESETRFRQLANATWEGILVHDDGVALRVNDMFARMFGYDAKGDLVGRQILELIAPRSRDRVGQIITEGLIETYEAVGLRRDGSEFPMEVRLRLMEYDGCDVRVAAVRDLTERKQLEARLTQVQKMEAIGTLAGGIAHDFNNILSAVIGYAELGQLELAPTSNLHRNFEQILRAGHRARDLVQQIMTFSRQSGGENRPIRLGSLLGETLEMLRASLPSTIEIRSNIASKSAIMADPSQLHQVFMNLCTNAGLAMREKGGVLEVNLIDVVVNPDFASLHPGLNTGEHVRLTVSDTGCGMGSEALQRIFDPFYTTREPGEGTGMGLAVVDGIIRALHGSITVASEPGMGTTFDLHLPVCRVGGENPDKPGQDATATGNEHILYVDDEPFLVELAEQQLGRLGYTVSTSTSSRTALEMFRAHPDHYDLVITDMTMPDMTGDVLAEELLSLRPDLPIIMCSGYSELLTQDRLQKAGIREFVMKPVVIGVLAAKIRAILDEKPSPTRAPSPEPAR